MMLTSFCFTSLASVTENEPFWGSSQPGADKATVTYNNHGPAVFGVCTLQRVLVRTVKSSYFHLHGICYKITQRRQNQYLKTLSFSMEQASQQASSTSPFQFLRRSILWQVYLQFKYAVQSGFLASYLYLVVSPRCSSEVSSLGRRFSKACSLNQTDVRTAESQIHVLCDLASSRPSFCVAYSL